MDSVGEDGCLVPRVYGRLVEGEMDEADQLQHVISDVGVFLVVMLEPDADVCVTEGGHQLAEAADLDGEDLALLHPHFDEDAAAEGGIAQQFLQVLDAGDVVVDRDNLGHLGAVLLCLAHEVLEGLAMSDVLAEVGAVGREGQIEMVAVSLV